MTYLVAFAVGAFLGVAGGVFGVSLCRAARKADDESESMDVDELANWAETTGGISDAVH